MGNDENKIHVSTDIMLGEQDSSLMRTIFKANTADVSRAYLDNCWKVLSEPDRTRARTQFRDIYGVPYVAKNANIVDNSSLVDENRQLKAKLAAYESLKGEAAKKVAEVVAKKTRKK